MPSLNSTYSFLYKTCFGFIWLLILFVHSQSDCLAQTDFATVIAEAEKSLVRIEVKRIEGGGLGSGFVVSESGRLVTNVHVLAGAQEAYAIFPNDETRYKIAGTTHIDEGRDICVAQLEANRSLIPIKLAEKLPSKGENIIGLGSPLGLSFTATRGIVSAIRQDKEMARDLRDDSIRGTWLQVDVALSPGNSGGPLINSRGEVVAMSTRASQGVAQNLNFGISVSDIRAAVSSSSGSDLTTLPEGVGKIKDHDVSGGGKPDDRSIVAKKSVPEAAITDYVNTAREDYEMLVKRVRNETSEQSKIFRLMKAGEIGIPPRASNADVVRVSQGKKVRYFFRSESVKRKRVRELEDRVNDLKKLRQQLAPKPTPSAVSALVSKAGPRLDPQEKFSVGHMRGAVVIHAFNDHEVVVSYEDSPFLMWVESTAGLSRGTELDPTPVFVSGTQTLKIPGQSSTLSVTTLQAVTGREMSKALGGSGSSQMAIWKSRGGQYTIEAALVKNDGTNVHLKKADGKVIKVPIAKLDEESQRQANRSGGF